MRAPGNDGRSDGHEDSEQCPVFSDPTLCHPAQPTLSHETSFILKSLHFNCVFNTLPTAMKSAVMVMFRKINFTANIS